MTGSTNLSRTQRKQTSEDVPTVPTAPPTLTRSQQLSSCFMPSARWPAGVESSSRPETHSLEGEPHAS